MTRLLMHPLRNGGSLMRAEPGRWLPVQNRDDVADIQLTEHVERGKRPGISSIPSPWARLQLFRDAIKDDQHPAHADVVNDILDALELVLFQNVLERVDLDPRVVGLAELKRQALSERKAGVARFLETLTELAPELPGAESVDGLTLIFNDGRLLFATSPFTLVFTPEAIGSTIPGYFRRNRAIRPLAERPPALALWVKTQLFPQLAREAIGALPEMMHLRTILEQQLDGTSPVGGAGERFIDAQIYPAPGVALQRVEGLGSVSALSIAPKRPRGESTPLPLVLDDSGSPAQSRYFPWLSRPADAKVVGQQGRTVLPGTSWRFDWVAPELDFLSSRLIVLDAPFYPDRVYTAGGATSDLAGRVLLPLTRRFFEFFRPEDVPRMLSMRATGQGSTGRVEVELTVPTHGDPIVVRREYEGSQLAGMGASFSVWPGFVTSEPPEWRDYYLISFLSGEDIADALEVVPAAGGAELSPQSFQRDLSTLVQHFEQPPECFFVRERVRAVGQIASAEGVILPKLKLVDRPTKPAWTVAIDFGTSNTVIAYADGADRQTLDIGEATRFDLTRDVEGDQHIKDSLDTFFFPASLEGRPFGTIVYRSIGADPASKAGTTPAVTANVPFSGDVSVGATPVGRHANEVVGDLKWGGGGNDGERLTRLFLHQVLQLVHAEARARMVNTEGMAIRWSYPSAFSLRKQNQMATRWDTMIREFQATRLSPRPARLDALASGTIPTSRLDEGTAAMLYLQRDPAAQGNFQAAATYMKLTADVGGGTTDVAAHAREDIVFRQSILFGGRDLIGDGHDGSAQAGIFSRLYAWAQRKGLPPRLQAIIRAYPSQHTKFTYLVRHPWFVERRGELAGEDWFPAVQACVLYFFSSIHYNIGLRLQTAMGGDVQPPDYLFFGGNGSGYLHWLTEFQPWNDSQSRGVFSRFFQAMLEAGYGKPLGVPFTVLTSSRPKQEVALGLLEPPPQLRSGVDASDSPVGEEVTLPGTGGTPRVWQPRDPMASSELKEQGATKLGFARPFPEREIARFNGVFVANLTSLAPVDSLWRDMSRSVGVLADAMDERFYDAQVRGRIAEHLERDDIGAVTLFVLETIVSLRKLERDLVGRGA